MAHISESPAGFPDILRPHVDAAFVVLLEVAAALGAKEPKPTSLAHVLMARPRKPIVQAAHDWAAWVYSAPPYRRPKDVVASYRNWLEREADLASTERLPGEAVGPLALPANVTPLRESAEERRMRRQARRMEAVRAGAEPPLPPPPPPALAPPAPLQLEQGELA